MGIISDNMVKMQCDGITKNGQPCQRQVTYSGWNIGADGGLYCHWHRESTVHENVAYSFSRDDEYLGQLNENIRPSNAGLIDFNSLFSYHFLNTMLSSIKFIFIFSIVLFMLDSFPTLCLLIGAGWLISSVIS